MLVAVFFLCSELAIKRRFSQHLIVESASSQFLAEKEMIFLSLFPTNLSSLSLKCYPWLKNSIIFNGIVWFSFFSFNSLVFYSRVSLTPPPPPPSRVSHSLVHIKADSSLFTSPPLHCQVVFSSLVYFVCRFHGRSALSVLV